MYTPVCTLNVTVALYFTKLLSFIALVTFIVSVMSSVHRRKSYTVLFKLQVIKWYHQNGENAHATANHFHIDRSVIRRWLTNELVLKKAKKRSIKRRMRDYKPLYPELDDTLFEYLCDERAAGRPVSNKQLMSKAMDIAPTLNVDDSFKASNMWLNRWKRRNRKSLRCATNDSKASC